MDARGWGRNDLMLAANVYEGNGYGCSNGLGEQWISRWDGARGCFPANWRMKKTHNFQNPKYTKI